MGAKPSTAAPPASLPGKCLQVVSSLVCGGAPKRSAPAELREAAVEGFAAVFSGARPVVLGVAPGRIEVLGNHTDYNEGHVLAAAIDKYVVIAAKLVEHEVCRIASENYPGIIVHFSAESTPKQSGDRSWANYSIGVVDELRKLGMSIGGFDAFVASNIPSGAGVSSSAAVEMATLNLLARLYPATIGRLDELTLARVARDAQTNFVGVGSGILDHFSISKGIAGSLLHLDCRTFSYGYLPLRDAQFVIATTHAPHVLIAGKYEELRNQCFAASSALRHAVEGSKIRHLRDVDAETLSRHSSKLSRVQHSVSKHIVSENDRVQAGIRALKSADVQTLGELMSASHASSRDDFGNSCSQLNIMQECADGIDGFLGARLMGGGFVGSTINLVKQGSAENFSEELASRYLARTGIKPTMLTCGLGDGAFSETVE